MHRTGRSLEYVNYMVECLGFFSGKNLNEIYFLKKALLVPEMNPLPEIRQYRRETHVLCLKTHFNCFYAGNEHFHLFYHKINVHLILL